MLCTLRLWTAGLALALIFGLFVHQGASAQSNRSAPKKSALLVADKKMADPRFRRTVVLLVSHGKEFSAGLVINRPTEITVGQLPLDLPVSPKRPVFYGGPVEPNRAHLLVQSDSPPEGAESILDDVYYIGSLAEPELPGDHRQVRLYAGFAGWAAGQLAMEIQRGDWHVVPGDAEAVFSEDTAGLWSRLSALFDAVWI